MDPVLTTITPVWGREQELKRWVAYVKAALHPLVSHQLLFMNEDVPAWIWEQGLPSSIKVNPFKSFPNASIGHAHNAGAMIARTEWIMKLDVDTIPHQDYWGDLLRVLRDAGPRKWFNAGMGYLSQAATRTLPADLQLDAVLYMCARPSAYFQNWKGAPTGTNFVCRRQVYLDHARCDNRFRGYGWEDYQQLVRLHWHELGEHPFKAMGVVPTAGNVTQLCRDRIALPKSRALFEMDRGLCLMHCWHPKGGGSYRNPRQMTLNRQVLLEHCQWC